MTNFSHSIYRVANLLIFPSPFILLKHIDIRDDQHRLAPPEGGPLCPGI